MCLAWDNKNNGLATGVKRIYHIAGLGELAVGGLKVVVAAAVSMEQYHRLACTLSGIENTDTIDFYSVSITFVPGFMARSRHEDDDRSKYS